MASHQELPKIVEQAILGGVTMVQLREKNCNTRDFIAIAATLKTIMEPYHVPLIINDRIDIALAVNADGIHIGQSDMPYHLARKLMGPDKIIGLSVEDFDQAMAANSIDVDYIGISPVFSTPTKTDTQQPFGLHGVHKVTQITNHPTVAIGGINETNAASIIQSGANGIAVVSAIMKAENPKQAAEHLKNIVS